MQKYRKDWKGPRREFMRLSKGMHKYRSASPGYLSDTKRHEERIHFVSLYLSDIGKCKVYVYEHDCLNRKPCFYIKSLTNIPFKTCIEIFDNKYVEEAVKDKLSDKQAEELYEFMNNKMSEYDNCNPDETVYERIMFRWSSCNYDDNVYFKSNDRYGDIPLEKVIPDYRLINKGGI